MGRTFENLEKASNGPSYLENTHLSFSEWLSAGNMQEETLLTPPTNFPSDVYYSARAAANERLPLIILSTIF